MGLQLTVKTAGSKFTPKAHPMAGCMAVLKSHVIHDALLSSIPTWPNQSKDWPANLNCFSIEKHKTTSVLYHLTKLHAIPFVYSRVREARHWRLQMHFRYRFLFSTSATSSSVENCPLTTMIKFLMTSSEQSTSRSPPTTAGIRLGFT